MTQSNRRSNSRPPFDGPGNRQRENPGDACRHRAVVRDDRVLAAVTAELLQILEDYVAFDRVVDPAGQAQAALLSLPALITRVISPDATGRPGPTPSPIDEYIEDMIDPEFGLRPARRIIERAAEHILDGSSRSLSRPSSGRGGRDSDQS